MDCYPSRRKGKSTGIGIFHSFRCHANRQGLKSYRDFPGPFLREQRGCDGRHKAVREGREGGLKVNKTTIELTPDLTSVESPEIPAFLPPPSVPKPNLSPEAIELLQAARDAILAHPERYNQDIGCIPRITGCGCILGWVVELSEMDHLSMSMTLEAERCLRISCKQVNKLFSTTNWPSKIYYRWLDATYAQDSMERRHGTVEQAQIAADRIDHFIATDGRE